VRLSDKGFDRFHLTYGYWSIDLRLENLGDGFEIRIFEILGFRIEEVRFHIKVFESSHPLFRYIMCLCLNNVVSKVILLM
jgi:hypothetical protein